MYVTSSWLKTGDFSSKIKNIEKQYPYMIIDYLYLKDNGQQDNINDYERFAYIKGKTADILKNTNRISVYYDEQGSLLMKDDKQQKGYTFMLELHGSLKVVDDHE